MSRRQDRRRNAPQQQAVPTVTAPPASEVVGAAVGGIPRIANAASGANVSGMTTEFAGRLGMILTGGATGLNPALRQSYDSLLADITRSTRAPSRTLARLDGQLTDLRADISGLAAKEEAGTLTRQETNRLKTLRGQVRRLETRTGTLQGRLDAQNNRLTTWEQQNLANAPRATDVLAEAFPEGQQTLDEANPYLDQLSQLGPAGEQLMAALGQGYQAAPIAAREVEQSELGRSMMDEAQRRVALRGQLDPQAARDAVQSARSAFAARGLGTGLGSAAAELLNRDRYSRQRAFEDLGFAQGVDQMDLMRRTDNAGRNLQGSIANESNRLAGAGMNLGMLGDAYSTQQGIKQMGLTAALERGRLAAAANPNTMMMNLYDQGERTGSQSIDAATSMANNWATNNLMAQGFNSNAIASQILGAQNLQASRYAANATQNAGMMGMIGGIGGGVATGAGLAIASASF
jgi:hypothetical protein